jgi:hypothetical protein
VIAEARTPQAIAAAIRNITTDPPARADTRAYAERFGWDETSAGQLALFARVIAKARPSSS